MAKNFISSHFIAVYVDDVLLTGSDDIGIDATKTYLQQHLSIRDLGESMILSWD